MGRGKRKSSTTRADVRHLAMGSEAGRYALRELLERIDLSLEPDVDLDALREEIEEGLALVASFHPEARTTEVRRAVYSRIKELLFERGIGVSADAETL